MNKLEGWCVTRTRGGAIRRGTATRAAPRPATRAMLWSVASVNLNHVPGFFFSTFFVT